MQEPGRKRVQDSWSKVELGALKRAVALHGRDWAAVASSVGSCCRNQCGTPGSRPGWLRLDRTVDQLEVVLSRDR